MIRLIGLRRGESTCATSFFRRFGVPTIDIPYVTVQTMANTTKTKQSKRNIRLLHIHHKDFTPIQYIQTTLSSKMWCRSSPCNPLVMMMAVSVILLLFDTAILIHPVTAFQHVSLQSSLSSSSRSLSITTKTTKVATPGPGVAVSSSHRRRPTTTTTLYLDPTSITDFVQGLDSALGNPTSANEAMTMMVDAAATAASTAAETASSSSGVASPDVVAAAAAASAYDTSKSVNMAISNTAVLVGGGLVTVAIGALAVVSQMMGNDGSADGDSATPTKLSSEKINALEQAVKMSTTTTANNSDWQTPSSSDDSTVESKEEITNESKEEDLIEKTSPSSTQPKEEEKKTVVLVEDAQNAIGVNSDSKSDSQDQKLFVEKYEAEQALLRKEMEEQLEKTKKELQEKYEAEQALRKEMETQLLQTKKELQQMEEQLKAEIAKMVETNQLLEDKYELEQNESQKKDDKIDKLNEDLNKSQKLTSMTQTQLAETQRKLTLVQSELQTTDQALKELQDENTSIRQLSKKIWNLSKSRVKNRFQNIKNKVFGRSKKQ